MSAAAKTWAPGWESARFVWLRRVLRMRGLSDPAKALAAALVVEAIDGRTGETRRRWDSLGILIGKAGRTVRRLAAELEALGFLIIERVQGRGNAGHRLRLDMPSEPRKDPASGDVNVLRPAAFAPQQPPEQPGLAAADTRPAAAETRPEEAGSGRETPHETRPVLARNSASTGRVHCIEDPRLLSQTRARTTPVDNSEASPPPSVEERHDAVVIAMADREWPSPFGEHLLTAERVGRLVERGRISAERGAELLAGNWRRAGAGGEGAP
ncbi:MAG: hypothetical protein U1E17_00060 [Geminicoccaceae bacterium]